MDDDHKEGDEPCERSIKGAQGERHGPWRIHSRRTAYDNPWIRVVHHAVTRPDGGPGVYGVVNFKNRAIGVLPVRSDGIVPLVGQFRFPLGRYSWELPEGGGPLNEDPLDAAKRELLEETGYSATTWTELCAFDVSNSVTNEEAVCFIATGLTEGRKAPDPTERLDHKNVSFSALLELVLSGEVRDSLTVIMVLSAREKARRGQLPDDICAMILAEPAGGITS